MKIGVNGEQSCKEAFQAFKDGKRSKTLVTPEELTTGRIFAIRLGLKNGIDQVTDLDQLFDRVEMSKILAMIEIVNDTRTKG